MVDTCVIVIKNSKADISHNVNFLDGKDSLVNPLVYNPVLQTTFQNTQNSVIFKPTELNMQIWEKYGEKVKRLYDQWWDKIKTSRDIEKNRAALEAYRASLKPGDIALLGCLTEGGQGLATANNGKYIAVRRSTKWAANIIASRPKKMIEAKARFRFTLPGFEDGMDMADYLSSFTEKEIADLFDSLKEKYGRDIFGQGYLYKIIEDSEIANVDLLTQDEKENGIDPSNKFWVPYDKGDKDGNRWYLETPFAIAWSKENVLFLKTNSGKKGEGMPVVRNPQFYFREGFCWIDVNSTYLKSRVKSNGVFDVLSMSLFTQTNIPDWYFVCLINSELISLYVDNFINNTSHFQINDARQLPIVIPSESEIEYFQNIYLEALRIKMHESTTYSETSIQEMLDCFVRKLYSI